ncbi:MAG: hypothetical protein PVI99_10320, partial [Anaerolineales bacterium]
MKVALGGAVNRATPPRQVVRVVAIPSISNARAASPTDWEQIGHAGTSSAASACSSCATFRISGIV